MKRTLSFLILLVVLAIVAFATIGQKIRSQKHSGNVNWVGTWVYSNDPATETVTISIKNNSLSASFKYTQSAGRSGEGEWKNCKIHGNTLTCDWTAEHDDPEQTGERKGTLKMTLRGDAISGSYLEDFAIWNWKPGYGPHVFDGSMGKNVTHSRNYKRQKPSN